MVVLVAAISSKSMTCLGAIPDFLEQIALSKSLPVMISDNSMKNERSVM